MSRARQQRRLALAYREPHRTRPHVALALACAAQYLGWKEEPLTVDHPMVDGERTESPSWAAESERYLAERDAVIGPGGLLADRAAQEQVLADLREDAHARTEAARAVRRRYGAAVLPLQVHAWGPGWRDAGGVVIRPRGEAS